jgi:hypothetical protein
MKWALVFAPFLFFLLPYAYAVTVIGGSSSDVGTMSIPTEFGMVTGRVTFFLGNLTWVPSEIWLIGQNVDPSVFSKGLVQQTTIEIPNVTQSTCRTAIYYNQTSGYGFKIYNTGTTTQIFPNGTFCGLAYNGTYFVFAKY